MDSFKNFSTRGLTNECTMGRCLNLKSTFEETCQLPVRPNKANLFFPKCEPKPKFWFLMLFKL
jgi:hypothetical protein